MVSERPGVVVQVLPASLGANMGLGGSLALASLSGDPDVLLTGGLLEDSVSTDLHQVRKATTTFEVVRGASIRTGLAIFDRVRSDALSGPESLELIAKVAEGCKP